MIAAIGTARSIHITPITNPHKIIEIKITTVFIPNVLFISRGARTLFSIVLIINITAATIIPHRIPNQVIPVKNAGIHQSNGPT